MNRFFDVAYVHRLSSWYAKYLVDPALAAVAPGATFETNIGGLNMKVRFSLKSASLAIVCLFFAACGGGGGNGNNDSGGTPPTGAPLTEPDRASSATIGSGGGTVSATGSNGVTYTLDVPVGALDQAVEIRLTPISDMGDAPLADNTFGAVQFEPSGLRFSHPATLRISALPTLAGGRRLVGFTSNNDGGAFRLDLARVDGESTLVNVSHFSAGGAAEATVDELPPIADLTPDLRGADDAIAQLAALTARNAGLVDIVGVFRQWYIEIVHPALEKADGVTDIALQTDAIAQYQSWIATMDYIDDRDSLNIALADKLNEAAPIATRIFMALIDRELANCGDLSSDVQTRLTALARASNAQNMARRVGLDSAGSGLDRAAFLLRVKECVQVMLDPISLPSPLSIGTDFSLDAQAKIIFNGSPTPDGAPFAFRVDTTGATVQTPEGFSDGEGRFTTVFRPAEDTVILSVRACLVLDDGTSDGVTSDLCAVQGTVEVLPPDIVFEGDVRLDSQERIDAFNRSGITLVTGDLDIELDFNLEPVPLIANLPRLTKVGGSLSIRGPLAAVSLPILMEVGFNGSEGDLLLSEVTGPLSSVSFPSLTRLAGSLFVTDNASLSSVRIGPVKMMIGRRGGGVFITDNASLTDLTLEAIEMNVEGGGGLFITDNTSLSTLSGVSCDIVITGNDVGVFISDNPLLFDSEVARVTDCITANN